METDSATMKRTMFSILSAILFRTPALAAPIDPTPSSNFPILSRGGEGPLRDMDLLAIGAVLVVILLILGIRKIFGKPHRS